MRIEIGVLRVCGAGCSPAPCLGPGGKFKAFEWRRSGDRATDCRLPRDRQSRATRRCPIPRIKISTRYRWIVSNRRQIRVKAVLPGKPGLKLGPVETLDRAGIDRTIANRVSTLDWTAAGALPVGGVRRCADVSVLDGHAGNQLRTAVFGVRSEASGAVLQGERVAVRLASLDELRDARGSGDARAAQTTRRGAGREIEMAYLRPLEIGNPSREEAEAAWRDEGRTAAAYRQR